MPESNNQRKNVTGHSTQNEGEVDPKFHVKRSASAQDWDPTFTLRTKVSLVNTGLKQKVGIGLKEYLRLEMMIMEEK